MAKFADLVGVSKVAVHKAVKNGRLTEGVSFTRNGQKYEFDFDAAKKEWDENRDENFIRDGGTQQQQQAKLRAPPFQESRAIREAYQARITKLEFEEKSNKLVDVETVKRQQWQIARRVRNAMLNIPAKIAAEVAAEVDPNKVEFMLLREINEALSEIAGTKGT